VVVESPSTNTHTAINANSGYSKQTETLSGPLGSAFSSSNDEFFVTESSSTVIGFADGGTGLFTLGNAFDTHLLGGAGLAINPSSNQMAVLYNNTDAVYLIDLLNPLFTQNYHELTAGNNVAGVAFDPLAGRLFVTSSSGNTVSAFDIVAHELVDAWEGQYGGNNIDYNFIDTNPATGMIYTLRLGNVFAINEAAAGAGANGTMQNSAGVTTIPLASLYSSCIAVNAATNRIYAGDNGNFYWIDGATNTAQLITGLPANTDIRALAVDHATNQIIAWDYFSGNVLVFDSSTNALVKTIPVGNGSGDSLVVDSIHNLAYLGGLQNLYVIDPAAGTVVTSIPLAGQALASSLNAPKSRLYVVDNFSKLYVVNTSTNALVTTITLPGTANAVAVNPFSGNFYAGLYFDLFEYNGTTNKLIKHFTNTAYPALTETVSLLANPLTDTIYVGTASGSLSSVLATIDERTGTVSGIPYLYDVATRTLSLDLGTGVLAGSGYSYTQLFFPGSDTSGPNGVPITVTGVGVTDASTITNTPIFRTKNTLPSFKITATSNFGINSTASVPTHLFYQVDGWQGAWKGATLKLQTGTLTSTATIKTTTALTAGLHVLYLFAGIGDVATIQAGLPSGNSVANSPAISPIASVVFTVEK
jgi:DNA-binding beta-propeller fold protein YncE